MEDFPTHEFPTRTTLKRYKYSFLFIVFCTALSFLYNHIQRNIQKRQSMEDSAIFVKFVLSNFIILDESINKGQRFAMEFHSHKSPDTDLQLTEKFQVKIIQKDENWARSVEVKFFFEVKQPIAIRLMLLQDEQQQEQPIYLGDAFLSLGEFISSGKSQQSIPFDDEQNREIAQITIKLQRLANFLKSGEINMDWRGGKIANVEAIFDFWKKNDSYLKFMKIRGDNTFVQVDKTEIQPNKLSPNWKHITIPLKNLIDDTYRPISFKVQCWHHGENEQKQIGEAFIQVEELKKEKLPMQFQLQSASVKKPGNLILDSYEIVTFPNIIDYLQEGLHMRFMVGIDFTNDNQSHLSWSSKHFTNKKQENSQYEKIVQVFWDILLEYNDQKEYILPYGFGAKPHFQKMDQNTVNNCFPLTADEELPYVKGIEQFHAYYKNSLSELQFFGPRKITPLLEKFAQQIKTAQVDFKEDEKKAPYNIVLILTAGDISDAADVQEFINFGSCLPASFIVVDISQRQEKKLLDFETKFDLNNKKRTYFRHYDYSAFGRDPKKIAKNALKNIPKEVVDQMLLIHEYPNTFNKDQIDIVERVSSK